MRDFVIKIENKTLIRIMVVVVLFVVGVNLVRELSTVITWIVTAFFLSLALNPAVSWISRQLPGQKSRRTLATGISYLCVLGVISLLLYLLVPSLVTQTGNFIDDLPEYANQLENDDSFIAKQLRQYNVTEEVTHFLEEAPSRIDELRDPAIRTARSVSGTFIAILTILVMTFMMLIEGPYWLDLIMSLQEKSKRQHRRELLQKMYGVVTGYINGQLLVACIATVSALVTLLIVGVPNPIGLAVVVGVLALIPMIGALVGAVIVCLISLFTSLSAALTMAIFFIIYQQIENHLIQPAIQSKSLSLTPLTVLVSALLGISIAGFLGAFIAIPVAGCIRVLVVDYLDGRGVRSKLTKPDVT